MMCKKIAALAGLILASGIAAGASADGRKTYIVQLKDEPAATYQGGVGGLAATQPAHGARFAYRSAAVQSYVSYLGRQQRAVAASVGHARVLAHYHVVFNGFSARLTEAEARALKANAGVAEVFEDQARKFATISTPTFLGLTAPGGLWSQTAGGALDKGEGLVIGVVDGGIWPENPSVADHVDAAGVPTFSGGAPAYGPPPASFTGGCVAGEGFNPAIHCNNKLVGAKFYNAGFLATGLTKNWSEFYSPRDSVGGNLAHGGHGDHTASTAAGNSLVPAIVNGIAMGPASGMAPRARIAAYKICWTYDDPAATDGTGSSNSCWNSDAVAAIDDAVKDGVNAINYSISGSQNSVADPVEQAFYRAALAGVFVAASAGNSGPGNAVAHISPWLSTVAASTHDRFLKATVGLGNGASYTGASLNTTPLPATPLIRADDAGLAGANPTSLTLCFSASANGGTPVLDPAKVGGKIVVCTRGTNARVDKSAAVAAAGGAGMIMVDNGAGLVAEVHSVPTVHVTAADGAAIKTYAAVLANNPTSTMSAFTIGTVPAPVMASFSSRGPNAGDVNVLKPDLTAPGVDVIASVTPALTAAQHDAIVAGTLVPPPDWSSYSGTSMSSPHVAGVSLLLKQAHPAWSPAAIKSALMTTAYTTLDDGQPGAANGLLPWAQGAGHINPNAAVDPGLVYDAGVADYVGYQCKVNRTAVAAADCTTYGTLDETYNLNLPSITAGTVVGNIVVKRRVTNVGAASATYTSSINVPGFTGVVSPATLTLGPGETKSFTVSMTAAGAVQGNWNFGKLTWTDGTHNVVSPVQLRAGTAISAPAEIDATSVSGTRLITVKTGFAGRMGSVKGGLKEVTLAAPQALSPSPINATGLLAVCTAGNDTAGVKVTNVTIPASTMVARFALRNEDVGTPGDDFDMLLMKSDGSNVVYSGNDGSNEAVQLANPAAGAYKVCVASYASTAASTTYRLSSWIVTPADTGGRFTVMLPSTVYSGGTATVGLLWGGLPAGSRYLGAVGLLDAGGVLSATTVVNVDTTSLAVQAIPQSSARKLGL